MSQAEDTPDPALRQDEYVVLPVLMGAIRGWGWGLWAPGVPFQDHDGSWKRDRAESGLHTSSGPVPLFFRSREQAEDHAEVLNMAVRSRRMRGFAEKEQVTEEVYRRIRR